MKDSQLPTPNFQTSALWSRAGTQRLAPGVGSWVVGLFLASCARGPIVLPSDPGSPLPDFAGVHAQLSSACTGVRTLTLELGLSGRAGEERLRGRVVAGFERPSSMRLEGVAPFGQPVFILAATDASGTLLLPRERRIIRDEPPEAILEALTGVALAPADLLAVLTGCVVPAPTAVAGRLHAGGWASIDVLSTSDRGSDSRATLFLRQQGGAWQLRAARRDRWQLEYRMSQGTFPESVRLSSTGGELRVDMAASLSQIETNQDLDAAAFRIEAPAGVAPVSIEELRDAGPLRGE